MWKFFYSESFLSYYPKFANLFSTPRPNFFYFALSLRQMEAPLSSVCRVCTCVCVSVCVCVCMWVCVCVCVCVWKPEAQALTDTNSIWRRHFEMTEDNYFFKAEYFENLGIFNVEYSL